MAARMSDEQIDALERRLSSDNQGDASELADEARRARESEAALLKAGGKLIARLTLDDRVSISVEAASRDEARAVAAEMDTLVKELGAALARAEGR